MAHKSLLGFLCQKVLILIFIVFIIVGCKRHHVYVEMPPGAPMRDVEIPSGATTTIPIGASLVGVAYEEQTDHIFGRLVGGTELWEVDRSGAMLRSFIAQQVTAGCDVGTHKFPDKECGLAMRYSDRHLFLDHPGGNGEIAEIDVTGNFIRNIQLNPHVSGQLIGGLAYDQQKNTIYVLYVTVPDVMIAEVDTMGNRIRIFNIEAQPFGLSISSERRELYLLQKNSTHLGVFDLNGIPKDNHALQGFNPVHGIGAGRR